MARAVKSTLSYREDILAAGTKMSFATTRTHPTLIPLIFPSTFARETCMQSITKCAKKYTAGA